MTKTTGSAVVLGAMAICFSAMLWGLDGIVLTPRLYNLNIILVVFVIHALPFAIMNVFLFNQYKILRNLSRSDLLYIFLVALTGGVVGTMAIVRALFLVEFRELTVVVLLQKLQPVFAISLAAILLREKLHKNFLIWAGIAIVAGYFLTFGLQLPDLSNKSGTALAAFYSLLAAFSFGSATVFSKRILHKVTFQGATFFRYGFTTAFMSILLVFTGSWSGFGAITSANWIVFFIIAFTTGSGAVFLYYFGLRNVKAMVATICELCFPLSAIVFDYLFNGKVLTMVQWVSAAIMLAAIIRLSIARKESI